MVQLFMPQNRSSARRVDDRRIISGIVHVLPLGRPTGIGYLVKTLID